MPHRRLLAAWTALVVGCSGLDRTDSPAVSDSLGVTVVEYRPTFESWAGAVWSTDSAPLFTIGDTGLALFRVRGAIFPSDGGVVIVNGGSQELLLFDAGGRPRARAGGSGGGPGEFGELTFLSVGAADSLFAYDARAHRLSVFDSDGGFVRAVTLRGLDTLGHAEQVGVLRDGTIVAAFRLRTPGTGLVRDSLLVVGVDPTGETVAPLGVFPHLHAHWGPHAMPGGGDPVAFPLPVAFSSLAAVAVRDSSVHVGLADRYALMRLDRSGVRRITRQTAPPAPLTEAHRERLFASLSEWMAGPELDIVRALRGPTTLPAFGYEALSARYDDQTMLVTDLDGVWLQPFQLPDSAGGPWPRFDATGRYEGTVHLPPGFRPTAVRGDVVLGVHRDAEDVETVRAYRLKRHR